MNIKVEKIAHSYLREVISVHCQLFDSARVLSASVGFQSLSPTRPLVLSTADGHHPFPIFPPLSLPFRGRPFPKNTYISHYHSTNFPFREVQHAIFFWSTRGRTLRKRQRDNTN